MTAREKIQGHTAAPQAAGYIFQLERALYHLSCSASDVSVAVEYIDDVVQLKNGIPLIQEQDKNTVRPGVDLLGDRSNALWRTLQIWVNQHRETGFFSQRYFIVTNSEASGPIASLLKQQYLNGGIGPKDVIEALRKEGTQRSQAKVVEIMKDVLSCEDLVLADLVGRIEIVDGFYSPEARDEVANGFAIHPRVDQSAVLDSLLGWLTRTLMAAWREQKPGLVSRKACIQQCREIENLLARERFLPRPSRDIRVGNADRDQALTRPFVEHLSRIEADDDDVLQAVEHFIQFNVEKHRLAAEGEVADREWRDRGDRLKQRWQNILRSQKRSHRSLGAPELGQQILAEVTYVHLEPLGGQPCGELYMTSGHYHRLADDDEVWWNPDYLPMRDD